MDFLVWKKWVEFHLVRLCGMSSDMLPDYDYRQAWENGETPEWVAVDAIDYAKTF